jgi:hypothetical protein
MDRALRVFLKTSRELRSLNSKAGKVRLPNVEKLVCEFREILTCRAIAAEALDVYDSPKLRRYIAELQADE